MAKPIFTIGFPKAAGKEQLGEVQATLGNMLKEDYYVIVYSTSQVQDITFDLFNVSDISESEVKELQDKVLEAIKKNEQTDETNTTA